MNKFTKIIVATLLTVACALGVTTATACEDKSKVITVCASSVPHAQVLNGTVKQQLAEQGYKLKVKVTDWKLQNDAVSAGDYDANYFQHVPYLQEYLSDTPKGNELFAVCKVHYEPLGIYLGKASAGTAVTAGKSFAICNDTSNAVRALQLLQDKGIDLLNATGQLPYTADEKLSFTATEWTTADNVKIKLIDEDVLVAAKDDVDFLCLPVNTALTGNVSATTRVAIEGTDDLVTAKANILAARTSDYQNNAVYQAKIDALANALLSATTKQYFETKYNGVIICDSRTQIDFRNA